MTGVSFERLERRPEFVDQVARWWFDEWGHESPGLSFDDLRARTLASLDELLPVTVLAMTDDAPVGVAELKAHELRSVFPERTPWLGGVYVPVRHRGQGIAARLVGEIERIAAGAGFDHLWLNTEAPDGGLYARLGWRPTDALSQDGVELTVLRKQLTSI